MKISVIGAGAVGATCAQEIVHRELASEVVLLDVKEGVAEGKALDLLQASTNAGHNVHIKGVTSDYTATKNSSVVVITSGIPRKPGMTREELIGTNAKIVQTVVSSILQYSPDAIFLIVSNPVDTLSYFAFKQLGLDKSRVLGLGGALDSARFRSYLSLSLSCAINDLDAMVIGGHGDTTMIPLIERATLKSQRVIDLLSKEQLAQIVKDTMNGGATLTKLLGTSAWYGPGSAVANMLSSIIRDEKRILPCSVYLEGEYNERDLFIGVPVVLGKTGVERVIQLNLSSSEQELFQASAKMVRATNALL